MQLKIVDAFQNWVSKYVSGCANGSVCTVQHNTYSTKQLLELAATTYVICLDCDLGCAPNSANLSPGARSAQT